MPMIKYNIMLILFIIVIILVNLDNVVSYSQDFSIQTTKTNNTDFDISSLILEPKFSYFNLTYADWTTKWWQWAYSIPNNVHPAYDDTGKFCKEGQKEPVWFFPGTYQQTVKRYCEIPYGIAILFPILNSECSFAEYPQMKTKEESTKKGKR